MERKEAIEVIKKNWPDSSFTMLREALETLIPELKESEDERVRKAIIEFFESEDDNTTYSLVPKKNIIAWLEKQGEQKSWSEEDEEIYRKCICAMRASACGFPEEEKFVEQVDNWFKFLKDRVQPKQEWSEEDKNTLNGIIEDLNSLKQSNPSDISKGVYQEEIDWLKSLRPRSQWKPSDRQMDALGTYIYNPQYFSSPDPRMELVESVYKDLKKLREE